MARPGGTFAAALFEQMPEAVALYRADGTLEYANAGAAKIFSRSTSELVGRNLWDLFPEAVGNEFHHAFERVGRTGAAEHFDHHYEPLGRWFHNSIYPIDGALCVITWDVTDEKDASARLMALADAGRSFSQPGKTRHDTLVDVARTLVNLLGDSCAVRLFPRRGEPGSGWRVFADRDPAVVERLERLPSLGTDEGFGQEVARSGEPVLLPQVSLEDLQLRYSTTEYLRAIPELGVHSMMAAPIWAEGRPVGAIMMARRQNVTPRPFTRSDLALLVELAERAALALQTARHLEEARQARGAMEERRAELEWLYRLSAAANRARRADELFAPALEALAPLLRVERASILLFDEQGVMRFRAWRGVSAEYRAAVEGHSPWTRDTRDARAIFIEDVDADPGLGAFRTAFRREGIRSLAFLPLTYGDRLLGKFMLYSPVVRAFDERDRELGQAVAAQVASAVGRCLDDEELQKANRRKDEFMAMLAHELRNPLAAMRSALEVIEAEGRPDRRPLAVLNRQTASLTRMVDDLLDVSRVTRGLVELKKERLDARDVVHRALEATRAAVDRRRQEIVLHLAEQPVFVLADAVRLEQVFVNLLSNASKYTDPGGQIRVSLAPRGSEAVLSVSDTGAGLAPEMRARVFDPFEQVQRPLDRSEGGLGIGLTIVKRLVELHDGAVEALSEGLGLGSTFVVRLPLAERLGGAPPPSDASEPHEKEYCRILVVDDHADSGEMLTALLSALGHEVVHVLDAPEAIARVAAFAPDLVLLDIGLPGMSGYDAAPLLREAASNRPMIVALTGYGQESDRARSRAAGFDGHLVKPVDLALLSDIVAQAVRRSALAT